MAEPTRTRRAFLGSLGAAALGAVAGCVAPVGSQTGATATRDRSNGTTGSPFTQVYRESISSVVLVQVAGASMSSQGSGFVFDAAGHVLTNQHVVEGAERIDLRFSDGSWRTASVVGVDVYSDLAVLAVDGSASPPSLPFVDSAPVIGTEVVAIGSPFGLERSLSAGIVSGTGRAIPTAGGFTIPDSVQTDAALNPGNSGGPLLTLGGETVGVIRSGGGDNIGFAISAALVRRVAPALAANGEYEHPYMGVGILDVSPTIADAIGLDRVTGVLVTQVVADGPSDGVLRGSTRTEEVAGVEVPVGGDVIVTMAGEPIPTAGALGRHLALQTRPGGTVPIEVVRDGQERTVELTLGARPPPGGVTG